MKNRSIKLAFASISIALLLPIAGASAQTISELQAQINSLLQLITQLQVQMQILAQNGTSPQNPVFAFADNLTVGSRGSQVEELQKFLVARGFLVMPSGVAFGYFGPLTQSALASFQATQNIVPPAGFFGPITRARINSILTAQSTTTPPITSPTSGTGITTPGVEGIMSITSSNAGISSSIYEGDEQAPILGMKITARASDIAVQRVKLNLGNSSIIYNKILERLYVTDGTNVLASADLNSDTVVREGNTYFITISGFNFIVPKDSDRNLIIKADVRPTIDSMDLGISRTVSLADNGVRGIDGAGIDHYSPSSGSAIARSLNVRQDLVETARLRISIDQNSPRTQEAIASSGANNDELDKLNLLTFDLKAERDDILVTDLEVNIAKTGTGGATASNTVYLYEGSTEIDNASVSNGVATFQNLDYRVPQDSTRVISVRTDVRDADTSAAVFRATVAASGITAENSIGDSLDSGDKSGSAIGYQISVRNIGPEITLASKSITTSGVPQRSGTDITSSAMTATFNLRLRAVGGDLILGTSASTTPAFDADTSLGVYRNGVLEAVSDEVISIAYSAPSGASTAGLTNSFRIPEGSEFTIPVTFQIRGRENDNTALPSGLYSIGFEGFNWVSETGAGTTAFMAGEQEWRTTDVSFP